MSVEKKFYGYTADQKEISSYTLTNKSGMKAVLLDIGAVIESLLVPDKNQIPEGPLKGYSKAQ